MSNIPIECRYCSVLISRFSPHGTRHLENGQMKNWKRPKSILHLCIGNNHKPSHINIQDILPGYSTDATDLIEAVFSDCFHSHIKPIDHTDSGLISHSFACWLIYIDELRGINSKQCNAHNVLSSKDPDFFIVSLWSPDSSLTDLWSLAWPSTGHRSRIYKSLLLVSPFSVSQFW